MSHRGLQRDTRNPAVEDHTQPPRNTTAETRDANDLDEEKQAIGTLAAGVGNMSVMGDTVGARVDTTNICGQNQGKKESDADVEESTKNGADKHENKLKELMKMVEASTKKGGSNTKLKQLEFRSAFKKMKKADIVQLCELKGKILYDFAILIL